MRYDLNEKKEVVRIDEDKETAVAVRDILKKKFGLSSRDVGVRADYGGSSSAVYVSIKSAKALPYQKEIENVGKKLDNYQTDNRTYEILAGGNTFVFVNFDPKFGDKIDDKIWKDMQKEASPEFLDPNNHDVISIKMYGEISIFNIDGKIEMSGGTTFGYNKFDKNLAGSVWKQISKSKNYKKIVKKYFRSV